MPQTETVQNPIVSVLIVTWNSAGTIQECLKSLRETTERLDFEVIVVDNAGSDGTAGIVKNDHPWVRLIETGANVGFARAMNLAASLARGRYLFLFNPDARVENDAVSILAGFLDADKEAGAASPDILEAGGGRSLAAVQKRPTLVDQFLRQFGLRRLWSHRGLKKSGPEPSRGDRLSGSAMMIPARVWSKVGPLNEELPLYFEDLDISTRIERAGLSLWRVPEAVVVHTGECSAEVFPQRRMLLAMENGQAPWMYFNLYHSPLAALIFNLTIFGGSLFRLLTAWTVGWVAFIRGDYGKAWRKRITANSSALLGWSWGSKKDFLIKVQFRFYGGPGAEKAGPVERGDTLRSPAGNSD